MLQTPHLMLECHSTVRTSQRTRCDFLLHQRAAAGDGGGHSTPSLSDLYHPYSIYSGLPVIFSPLIVDGPIILAVVFLFGALPEALINGIRIAGGLLLWIAWWIAERVLCRGRSGGSATNPGQQSAGAVC